MRTTVDIADDVLLAVKERARTEGRSIGAVLTDLARRGLGGRSPRRRDGFPVFDVPADAPVLTSELVQRALDDE